VSDTRHIEYARACTALRSLSIAIAQLQVARSELSVTAGEQRKCVSACDDALLGARRAYADAELVIKTIGRSAT